MDPFQTAVTLIIKSMVISARWAAASRLLGLRQAASRPGREAEFEARIQALEDKLAQRDATIALLRKRLGQVKSRRPYTLGQRLRILWLIEYFRIPKRRVRDQLGVSRASIHRWLRAFERGDAGRRGSRPEPANKTPKELAALIWRIFEANPIWGRHRIAMTLWALGVFAAASTVRNILLRPRPRKAPAAAAQADAGRQKPRQIVACYPNHVWSVDRTRVWLWGLWPTWALVAIDHFSRKVTAVSALEGPNAGWVVEALESAFQTHGPPKHLITDQEGVFTGSAFAELLRQWAVKQRFGAVGKHGSIAVTERVIQTLKHEWLRPVPIIRGSCHLTQLLEDFEEYYNDWRGHMTLGGALPAMVHRGEEWARPAYSARQPPANIEQRTFADSRVTAFRLAA